MMRNYYQDLLYIFINFIRLNPNEYEHVMNIQYICTPYQLNPVSFDLELMTASTIKWNQLKDPQCWDQYSIDHLHDTCPKYCHLYTSCSYIDRVKYYCNECINIAENLIAYKKSPIKALHTFLEVSIGHCENLFDYQINSIGLAGDGHPLYIQTFAHKITSFFEMKTICSYLYTNEFWIRIYCLATSVKDIQLQFRTDQFNFTVTFETWLTYYSYQSQDINVENTTFFTLSYLNGHSFHHLHNINESFYIYN